MEIVVSPAISNSYLHHLLSIEMDHICGTLVWLYFFINAVQIILNSSQPTSTCSKFTIKVLEQGMKYVQS